MVEIIGDFGSCHDGTLDKARELVRIGSECGLTKVKAQLLTDKETKTNTLLPWEWLPELIALGKEKGVEVFASVFDKEGIDWLTHCESQSIKFAYSSSELIWTHATSHGGRFKKTYASYDVMSPNVCNAAIKLFCIPLYPVPYIVDFEGIFPRFDGFSSHCLGINQEIRAVEAGAKYLEFHFQGPWYSPTPDGRFAKTPEMTAKLVRKIRDLEMPYHVHDGYGYTPTDPHNAENREKWHI